jgi:hypothetical protein
MQDIKIPNGYKQCAWLNSTHALSNGKVIGASVSNYPSRIIVCGTLYQAETLSTLGLIPLRKLPTVDLSPLTEEEFHQLRPGDTFIAPVDALKTVEAIGVGVIYDTHGNRWMWRESGAMTPTPETARRLRGEGKQ